MIYSNGKTQKPGPNGDNLEPYRRMVEMQRQIIELMKKQEQAKRENVLLRQQVAREIAVFCRPRQGVYPRLRHKAELLWQRARQLGSRIGRVTDAREIFPSPSQPTET